MYVMRDDLSKSRYVDFPMQASVPGAATSLYRTSESDAALSMAQRLGSSHGSIAKGASGSDVFVTARKWKKQIILAIDVPQKFENTSRVTLEVEKRIGMSLNKVEGKTTG